RAMLRSRRGSGLRRNSGRSLNPGRIASPVIPRLLAHEIALFRRAFSLRFPQAPIDASQGYDAASSPQFRSRNMARRPRHGAAPVVVMAFPLTHRAPGIFATLVAACGRAVPMRMAQYTPFESGLNGQTASPGEQPVSEWRRSAEAVAVPRS